MTHDEMLRNIDKLKFSPTDIYLLALRQILSNQYELLLLDSGRKYQCANDTGKLVKRIDEFIENKQ